MKRFGWILLAFVTLLWPAVKAVHAQTAEGANLFEDHCAKCHGNPASGVATPEILTLWKLNRYFFNIMTTS